MNLLHFFISYYQLFMPQHIFYPSIQLLHNLRKRIDLLSRFKCSVVLMTYWFVVLYFVCSIKIRILKLKKMGINSNLYIKIKYHLTHQTMYQKVKRILMIQLSKNGKKTSLHADSLLKENLITKCTRQQYNKWEELGMQPVRYVPLCSKK